MPDRTPNPTTDPTAPPYDRDAIFDQNGPIDPRCVEQAICTIIRNTPIDPGEPRAHAARRTYTTMRAFAALHPRDEIEIMLCVQALCAYHAATACWRLAANPSRPDPRRPDPRRPDEDKSRHISKAATAVRTFDTVLRALERRQAKPLAVPAGRPASRDWPNPDLDAHIRDISRRCDIGPDQPGDHQPGRDITVADRESMNDDELISALALSEPAFLHDENIGLDLANTEGILPGGGMIVPEQPTPQQGAYIERRLRLMYLREKQQIDRDGSDRKIVFRPLRTGDLVT
jgi:hypothetical protein